MCHRQLESWLWRVPLFLQPKTFELVVYPVQPAGHVFLPSCTATYDFETIFPGDQPPPGTNPPHVPVLVQVFCPEQGCKHHRSSHQGTQQEKERWNPAHKRKRGCFNFNPPRHPPPARASHANHPRPALLGPRQPAPLLQVPPQNLLRRLRHPRRPPFPPPIRLQLLPG